MSQKRHFYLEFATTMCLAPKMVVWWEVRKESKAGCCDTLSPSQHGHVALLPVLLTEVALTAVLHPSWPGHACNSLLPSGFSWWHISNSSIGFRIGATGQLVYGESWDLWDAALVAKGVGEHQELSLLLWPGRAGGSDLGLPKQRLMEMSHLKDTVMSQFLPTVD